MPRRRSMPLNCSCLARSQPARDSSRSPPTVPPQAITDCTRATERALPKPLAAGICARRQAALFRHGPGGRGRGGRRARWRRNPRPGMAAGRWAPPGRHARGQPDVEVGAQRSGHLSAKKSPRLRPVIRRTTSPTRNPWVSEWYPAACPAPIAEPVRPAVPWRPASHRDLRLSPPSRAGPPYGKQVPHQHFPLPAAANSGQYRPTGAARSSMPRSARISAHSAVIVLVTDQTFVIVSRCHPMCGRRRRTRPRHPPRARRPRRRPPSRPRLRRQQSGQRNGNRGEQFVVRALDGSHMEYSARSTPREATDFPVRRGQDRAMPELKRQHACHGPRADSALARTAARFPLPTGTDTLSISWILRHVIGSAASMPRRNARPSEPALAPTSPNARARCLPCSPEVGLKRARGGREAPAPGCRAGKSRVR